VNYVYPLKKLVSQLRHWMSIHCNNNWFF